MRAFACVLAISLAAAGPAQATPLRVASLKLCTDELLMAVADPRQIVSVTYLAQQPREYAQWRQARAFAANDGSLLSVVRHRPDLVIDMGGAGGRDSERIARRLGIGVLNLRYPQNLRDMEDLVMQVSRALGREQAGRSVVARFEQLRQSRPPRLSDALWLGGGGLTIASSGLGAEWMALAGLKQRQVAGDRVTLEQLIVAPPPILLRSDYRIDQYSSEQRWLMHPLVAKARVARTIATDGRPWTCLGPPMIEEVRRLRTELAR